MKEVMKGKMEGKRRPESVLGIIDDLLGKERYERYMF